MKNMHFTRRRVALAALVLVAFCGQVSAQSIPASSADSGRRASIAINQTAINNSINNAVNTGNAAWNYADAAYNGANNAYNTAVAAYNTANYAAWSADTANARVAVVEYGSVATTFATINGALGAWNAQGICLRGYDPNALGYSYGIWNPCPAGSGPYATSLIQNAGGQGE